MAWKSQVANFPAGNLVADVGNLKPEQIAGSITLMAHNVLPGSADTYLPMRKVSSAFGFLPAEDGYPLASRTIVVGEWSVSVAVTPQHLYVYVPTRQIGQRWEIEAWTFQFTAHSADIAFYQDSCFICSDTNPLLRIDLSGVRGDDLTGWNPIVETVAGAGLRLDPSGGIGAPPPNAHLLTTVNNFLFMANYREANEAEFNPRRLRWSAFNNPIDWKITAADRQLAGRQAGDAFFPETEIVDMIGVGRDLYVFGTDSIIYGSYTGGLLPFTFDKLTSIGVVAKGAAAVHDRTAYFMSHTGFWALQGNQSLVNIGEDRVNDYISERLNYEALDRMHTGIDTDISCIVWSVPVDGSPYNNLVVFYNYVKGTWTTADLNVAFAMNYAVPPLRIVPRDERDHRTFDNFFEHFVDLPFRPSSPVWSGTGASEFGWIDSRPTEVASVGGEMISGYAFRSLNGDGQLPCTIEYPALELVPGSKCRLDSCQLLGDDVGDCTVIICSGDTPACTDSKRYYHADAGGYIRVADHNAQFWQITVRPNVVNVNVDIDVDINTGFFTRLQAIELGFQATSERK